MLLRHMLRIIGDNNRNLPTSFQDGSDITAKSFKDLEAIALILVHGKLLP
jgi:hypothetical protein